MKNEMSHELCSELMPGLVRGDLEPATAARVEAHLATCAECRTEHSAVVALIGDQDDGLTEIEAASLQQRVAAVVAVSVAEPATSSRFGRRMVQVLSAAAAVGLFGGLLYLAATSGGLDSATNQVAGGGTEEAESGDTGGGGGGGSHGGRVANKALSAQDSSVPDATEGATAPIPAPAFTLESEPLSGARLERLGRSGLTNVTYANYYSPADARGAPSLLRALIDAARATSGTEYAEQIRSCGEQVLESEDAILPTFAMVGELDGREVLVIGFIWSDRGKELDHYMVWAWERGSCATAVEYVDGVVERGGR